MTTGTDDLPDPVEISTDEAAFMVMFPPDGQPDPTTPIGAAWLWFGAIKMGHEMHNAFDRLSFVQWDMDEMIVLFDGLTIRSKVQWTSATYAYVSFIPCYGATVQVFEDFLPERTVQLGMQLCDDGWWRVEGVTVG